MNDLPPEPTAEESEAAVQAMWAEIIEAIDRHQPSISRDSTWHGWSQRAANLGRRVGAA